MGIPLVGERHQRKASTSQTTDRKFGAIPNRIRSASGSGCSSTDHQQSFQPHESSSDNREHFVGALLSRRVAAKGDVHARRIQFLCKELDTPAVGNCAAGRNKDRRGGALATSSGSGGWDQGQDQMRVVGSVFTRRSLGILWSQSDFVGDSGRKWRKERSKHWRARQCETSRSAPGFVIRASETWSDEIRISRPVARVSGWSVGHTSRRTRCPALVGLQLRRHELQRSTLVLLAQRRTSESDKNGSVGQSVADASGAERCVAGMEVADRIQRTWDFVFPFLRCKGKEPLDLAAVLKKKIQPAFASVGILGVGWHTFRHTVGTMLADMGEHQLTIRDYLRHSNLHVTNKYLQATPESKRSAQGKLVDAILPGGLLSASKSTLVQ